MIFLLLQQLGARVLECFFAFLVAIISFCFIAELSYVGKHVSVDEVFSGLFAVGYLESPVHVSAYIAVSMLGALVMPHNLFLHSALVLARDKETDPSRARNQEEEELLNVGGVDSAMEPQKGEERRQDERPVGSTSLPLQ